MKHKISNCYVVIDSVVDLKKDLIAQDMLFTSKPEAQALASRLISKYSRVYGLARFEVDVKVVDLCTLFTA